MKRKLNVLVWEDSTFSQLNTYDAFTVYTKDPDLLRHPYKVYLYTITDY